MNRLVSNSTALLYLTVHEKAETNENNSSMPTRLHRAFQRRRAPGWVCRATLADAASAG
jgi:hypothetical protein